MKILVLVSILILTGCDKLKDLSYKAKLKYADSVSCDVKDSESSIILKNLSSSEVLVEMDKVKEKYQKVAELNNLITLQSNNHQHEVIVLNKEFGTLVKVNVDKNPKKHEKTVIEANCK